MSDYLGCMACAPNPHIATLKSRVAVLEREQVLWRGGTDAVLARAEAAETRVKELERLIFDAGLWRTAPCCLCGYNGQGYFQPETHACAAMAGKEEKP